MTRRILIEIALFALPFVLQFLYFVIRREVRPLESWPLRRLTAIGAALAIGALLLASFLSESDQGLCFQAARYEDGRFIEGVKLPCDQVQRPEAKGATSGARD